MDARRKAGHGSGWSKAVAEINVMSAGAVKSMVAALGAEFERETGNKLNLNFNTAGATSDRVKNGEITDIVILSESLIAGLDKLGFLASSTITDLGRTVTGVIVKDGAAVPDISTPAAFKQALLDARTVAYTDPKAGGSGGIMFAGLLEKLDIADTVNKKAVLCKGGYDVAGALADGRAEFGTTFISEALPVPGVKVIGPLPGDLHYTNGYTAAIHGHAANPAAAAALLRFLTNPAYRGRWVAAGLEPAF